MQVLTLDSVVPHRPTHCEACQFPLEQERAITTECRQVHDLPTWRLQVEEYCRQAICCPCCQHVTQASFPAGVDAAVQYNPQVQALAVYLPQFQLVLPYDQGKSR